MTTICATRFRMGADWRASGNGTRYKVKKIRRIGEAIVGAAGDSESCAKFLAWMDRCATKNEPPPKLGKDAELEALILTPAGLFVCGRECVPEEIEDVFFAIGSGAAAALGALHMGATVETAVEVAAKVDPATGDGMDVLTL